MSQLLSRDEWIRRGRFVCAPNEEAKDVHNFYLPNVRGTRHVFAQEQTIPLEQVGQQTEVAA